MLYELLFGLIMVALILILIMTIIVYKIYKMHKTYAEKTVFILYTFFFFLIFLYFITLIFPYLPLYYCLLSIASVGFFLTVYAFFVLLSGVGEIRPKKERVLMLLYVSIISIIFLPIVFFTIEIVEIENHTYFGLSYPFLIGPTILILIPESYIIIIGFRKFFNLYDDKTRYILIVFFTALSSYIFSQYLIFLWIGARIFGAILLISSSIVGIILLQKDPNIFLRLSTTFAFKRILLIKNNGQTIFSHNFTPEPSKASENNTIDYLIGGFIYAITHGIKEIMKQDYGNQLRSMDFGNLKMLFYYRSQIFGVLFSTTANTLMYNKLQNFVDVFEKSFPELIRNQDFVVLEDHPQTAERNETLNQIKALLKTHFKF